MRWGIVQEHDDATHVVFRCPQTLPSSTSLILERDYSSDWISRCRCVSFSLTLLNPSKTLSHDMQLSCILHSTHCYARSQEHLNACMLRWWVATHRSAQRTDFTSAGELFAQLRGKNKKIGEKKGLGCSHYIFSCGWCLTLVGYGSLRDSELIREETLLWFEFLILIDSSR